MSVLKWRNLEDSKEWIPSGKEFTGGCIRIGWVWISREVAERLCRVEALV